MGCEHLGAEAELDKKEDQAMEKVIVEIEKNASEYLRISLTEFKNYQLVDLRCYYEGKDGKKLPTKKGVCFKTEILADVIQGLTEALKELPGDNGKEAK